VLDLAVPIACAFVVIVTSAPYGFRLAKRMLPSAG
jgi:hypothetical protein